MAFNDCESNYSRKPGRLLNVFILKDLLSDLLVTLTLF